MNQCVFSGIGAEAFEEVGGKIPLDHDVFEDGGTSTHHLIDLGHTFEDDSQALLHIAYGPTTPGEFVAPFIRLVDADGVRIVLDGTACHFQEVL